MLDILSPLSIRRSYQKSRTVEDQTRYGEGEDQLSHVSVETAGISPAREHPGAPKLSLSDVTAATRVYREARREKVYDWSRSTLQLCRMRPNVKDIIIQWVRCFHPNGLDREFVTQQPLLGQNCQPRTHRPWACPCALPHPLHYPDHVWRRRCPRSRFPPPSFHQTSSPRSS